jgi:hypothetical protein
MKKPIFNHFTFLDGSNLKSTRQPLLIFSWHLFSFLLFSSPFTSKLKFQIGSSFIKMHCKKAHTFSPSGSTFNKCNFTHLHSLFFSLPSRLFLSPFLMLRLTLFVNILFSYKCSFLGILTSVIKLT